MTFATDERAAMNSTTRLPSNPRGARHVTAVLSLATRVFELLAVAAILAVLSGPGRVWAVEPWPEMPMPPKANVQWIAQNMRVNGVPTRVMQFHSRASREEVIAYYTA